jgi:hypothetical protein
MKTALNKSHSIKKDDNYDYRTNDDSLKQLDERKDSHNISNQANKDVDWLQ